MSESRPGPLLALPAHAPPVVSLPERLCPAVMDLSGPRSGGRVPRPLRRPLELYLAEVGRQDGLSLRRARELLDTEERARAAAFHRPRDRDAYVVAHAALRGVLSTLLGIPAEALPLVREPCAGCGGPHGRPALRSRDVHFSLSHSGDLVVVALAPTPVGVDVEGLATTRAVLDARPALHVAEAEELALLPVHERPAAFTRTWVRKEAYLKGLGTGLVRDPALDYVGTGPRPAAPAPEWTLRDVLVPAGYAAAVALRTG
ncbi:MULTISPECIES: 4'-phosphopantetheinyl transferase superfamily protein [unclassified Streptomyces]|uniref:4'-phosphopantetheinyl transferase family protein n=1 Tax=unclassified Streptomyces TaxID=2593676 RepID=UPI001F04456E|nr:MULTISPECIES: 4'-phosphopantetheinyl transferase superfamily protein [unclassified Streptomyces]MCH0565870.1 4'-phosphopantetheinyl transferase superfamily protein [Streptomyces sp. MUM 2J]MCH0569035.1 4'-phosphopantetheinyl transferase superfamily protein [Streptomyces sp. MUM 136J]